MKEAPLLLLLACCGCCCCWSGSRASAASADVVRTALGEPASLRCPLEFPGGLVRSNTVHWIKQGEALPLLVRQEGHPPRLDARRRDRVSLAGPADLRFHAVRPDDLGWYECRVVVHGEDAAANAHHHHNTTWVLLELNEDDPIRFSEEPEPALVRPGDEARLRCAASPPAALLRWTRRGQFLDPDHDHDPRVTVDPDRRGLVLRPDTPPPQPTPERSPPPPLSGPYRCVASLGDRLALSSRPALVRLPVLDAFEERPSGEVLEFPAGSDALLPCHAPASVPAGILRLLRADGTALLPRSERVQLLPGSVFLLRSVRRSDEGTYRCSLENPLLNATVQAPWTHRLAVPDQALPRAPRLVVTPGGHLAVAPDSNVTLHCRAAGNPPPTIAWQKYGGELPPSRHAQHAGDLILSNVRAEDAGTYLCRATNGVEPPDIAISIVELERFPSFVRPLSAQNQTVTEGAPVTLECLARGVPAPTVLWVHNGHTLASAEGAPIKDGRLTLRKATLASAGFYQCFATNDLGTASTTARLRVFPRTPRAVPDGRNKDVGTADPELPSRPELPNSAGKESERPTATLKPDKPPGRRTKTGTESSNARDRMVPPSRPEVTKLSDESVMVRWNVPENDGLPISFFKVQYRDVFKSNTRWMTTDDEIAPHIHSFEVSNLKLGHTYRFRIAAVYSNNDNNLGPNSAKFLLQKDPPMKKPTVGPEIVHAEAVSISAILIQWEYLDVDSIPIEGFFVYYRQTTSAGEYLKVTVLGANVRSHTVRHLEPKVTYEIKMQGFNSAGTSDFSNIVTHTTLDWSRNETVQITTPVPPPSNKESLFMVLTIVLGVALLLLAVPLSFYAWKHWRHRGVNDPAVKRVQAYDDSFLPNEMELQNLTSTKLLNGNNLPSNGCATPVGYVPIQRAANSFNPQREELQGSDLEEEAQESNCESAAMADRWICAESGNPSERPQTGKSDDSDAVDGFDHRHEDGEIKNS